MKSPGDTAAPHEWGFQAALADIWPDPSSAAYAQKGAAMGDWLLKGMPYEPSKLPASRKHCNTL